MIKKFFQNKTVPGRDDSSSDSGESECVSPEEVRAATEDRYFFRKPLDFAPTSSNISTSMKASLNGQRMLQTDNLQKMETNESQMKRSRSFSFRFRPHSNSIFKVPRSKSVHFAEQVQVADVNTSEPPRSKVINSSSPDIPSEENRSSSSMYTDETADSSASENTMKRVGESLETIFKKRSDSTDENTRNEIVTAEDTDSGDDSHNETFEVGKVEIKQVTPTITYLYKIYEHLCHTLELRPQVEESFTMEHLETDIHTCIEDLQANLKSTTEIMHGLKSRIKRREEESAELFSELETLKKQLNLLEETVYLLRNEIMQLKENKMDSDECEQMHQELSKAYQEIDKIVSCYEKELSECKTNLLSRAKEIILIKENNSKEESALRSQYDDAMKRCNEMEKSLHATNTNKTELKEIKSLHQRNEREFELQIGQLQREVKDLNDRLEESEKQNHKLEREKDKMTSDLNGEISLMRSKLNQDLSTGVQLQEANRMLKTSLEEKIQEYDLSENQNLLLRNQIKKLQRDLDDQNNNHSKHFDEALLAEYDKVKKFQISNTALRSQVLELEAQVAKGTSQLRNCQLTISKLQLEMKTAVLKEKARVQDYQAVHNSNTFVVGVLRKYMKTTFEILAPMFHHSSADEFTQVFYEYSRVQIFDVTHHSMVTLLLAFLLAAVRDIVREYMRVERLLEAEIGNRQNYQKEVLQMFSKILRLLVDTGKLHGIESNRSSVRRPITTKKSKKELTKYSPYR